MNNNEKIRTFIAIDIKASSDLIAFENEFKNIDSKIKIVEPKNIHITIKFLGDTNIKLIEEIYDKIKYSVKEIKPFDITLKGTGVFPDTNYIKVIWVGIKNGILLEEISNKIEENLNKIGIEKEKRKFSAHLTIARVKSAKNKDKILKIIEKYKNYHFGKINVNSIILKKSELTPKGPIYTNIKNINL
jgi:2'-5' RNA ligase